MKERPILFSAPMVRAILEGRKTQTRRVVKPQALEMKAGFGNRFEAWGGGFMDHGQEITCPYGQSGHRLWVREAHLLDPPIDGTWPSVGDTFASVADIPECFRNPSHVRYRADDKLQSNWRWRPSIHMPRWAARITLEVTDVRVERLQAISEDDARAEGVEPRPFPGPWWQGYKDFGDGELVHQEFVGEAPPDWMIEPKRMRDRPWLDRTACHEYRVLWDSINGAGAWEANPWVWVVGFRRLET